MRKFNLMCLGLLAGATLAGCSDDALRYDDARTEAYVKDFIDRYGVPEADHTFSMVSQNFVTVKTSVPTDVKVAALVGSKEYLFADWENVSGSQKIDFDLPKGITDVRIYTNDRVFNTPVGSTIDLDAPSDKVRSREANGFDIKKVPSGRLYSHPYVKLDETNNFGFYEYFGAIGAENNSLSSNYYNNPENNDSHNWRSHQGMVPASVLEEFVGTTEDFYSKENGFSPVNYTRQNWTSPSLYIHYIKKSLNFEIGILVGNNTLLSRSWNFYMLPMFTTEGHDKNQMCERAQSMERSGNFSYRGASIVLSFDSKPFYDDKGNAHNVHIDRNGNQNEETFTWDFNSDAWAGAKETVVNLAKLYEKDDDGNRPLPLEVDLVDGIEYTTSTGTHTIPAWILGEDEDGNTIYNSNFSFYNKFQEYQSYKLKIVQDDENLSGYYNELQWLKEWFVTRRFVFEWKDIPVVTHYYDPDGNLVENAYRITYPLARSIDGDGDYIAINGQTQNDQYYTQFPYKYACYAGLYGGQTFPDKWNSHEYVYYVKNLNKSPGDEGYIVTTADAKMVEMFPYLNVEGHPAYGGTTWKCMDIDGDGIPNDIVFDDNTTGGGPNRGIDPYTWLFACEDLGTTGDVDFNDVVMAVSYVSTNSTTNQNIVHIRPLAAGGIYPVYFMYNDRIFDENNELLRTETYFVGPEVHSWLGSDSYSEKVNTAEIDVIGETNVGKSVEYIYRPALHSNNQFTATMGNLRNRGENSTLDDNQSFGGFWVLVDKDNQLSESGLTTTDYCTRLVDPTKLWEVASNAHRVVNIALDGGVSVPMMMVTGDDWEWPQETINIAEAYPSWKKWLTNRMETHWYGLNSETHHYPEDINRNLVTVRDKVEREINNIKAEDELLNNKE